jgi:hypothetical protein
MRMNNRSLNYLAIYIYEQGLLPEVTNGSYMEIQMFHIDIGTKKVSVKEQRNHKLTSSKGLTLCKKKPSTFVSSPPGLGFPMYKIELSRWRHPQSPAVLMYAF